jgi:hypothetical protein
MSRRFVTTSRIFARILDVPNQAIFAARRRKLLVQKRKRNILNCACRAVRNVEKLGDLSLRVHPTLRKGVNGKIFKGLNNG